MYKLRDKIQLVLKQLECGAELRLKSGHTLVMAEGHDEPGFKVHSSERGEMVMQIGSDVAWMMLISHAKEMTREDCIKFVLDNANVTALARKSSL